MRRLCGFGRSCENSDGLVNGFSADGTELQHRHSVSAAVVTQAHVATGQQHHALAAFHAYTAQLRQLGSSTFTFTSLLRLAVALRQ